MEFVARPSFIVIARIARPRGNRGEVIADLCTDFPDRFRQLKEVWLEHTDQRRELHVLEECWLHQGRLVLKLAAIDSISDAKLLAGTLVEVDASQAVPLPEGLYYDHDLVGCRIISLQGVDLGTVAEVVRFAGNHQLRVEGRKGEFLIPAAGSICREICIERKEIRVDLPEGLIELNR